MNSMNRTIDHVPAALRNGTATVPNTLSAQQNNATLLRASQEVGYQEVGRVAGHSKAWVSRVLSCECVMSLPELLTWLDKCDLRIVPAERLTNGTDHEQIERVAAALAGLNGIESALEATKEDGALFLALLPLARRQLSQMAERSE